MYLASTFFLHHLGSVCVLIDPQGYLQLQANAVSLASGLPHIDGGNNCVLYPSSAKAGSDLQVMLVQNRVHTLMCNCRLCSINCVFLSLRVLDSSSAYS